MSEWKEVWEIWCGNKPKPENVTKAMGRCDVFIDDTEYLRSDSPQALEDWYGSGGYQSFIYAYTTSQKRRRVGCRACIGRAIYDGIYDTSSCPNCKGKGYVWEYKNDRLYGRNVPSR